MAVVGPREFGLCIGLGAQGGSHISMGREDFAGGSTVLPPLSDGLDIELFDFEAQNATLNGDLMGQVLEIAIGGDTTVLEVYFMCLLMSLGRQLLQGCVSRNVFHPMSHDADIQNVEVGIYLLGNLNLEADIISLGLHFSPLLGLSPSFSIHCLIYIPLLHEFRAEGIALAFHSFPTRQSKKASLKVLPGYKVSSM